MQTLSKCISIIMSIERLGLWCLNRLHRELTSMLKLDTFFKNRTREEFIAEIQECMCKIPDSVDIISLRRVFSSVYGYNASENASSSWLLFKLQKIMSKDDVKEHTIGNVFLKHGEVLVLTGLITQSSNKMGLFYSHKTKQECAFEMESMLPFRVEKHVIPIRKSRMQTRKPSVEVHSLKGKKKVLCSRGCGKRKHKGMCSSRKVFRCSKGHSLCEIDVQESVPVSETRSNKKKCKTKIEELCPKCVEGRKKKGHRGAHTRKQKNKNV